MRQRRRRGWDTAGIRGMNRASLGLGDARPRSLLSPTDGPATARPRSGSTPWHAGALLPSQGRSICRAPSGSWTDMQIIARRGDRPDGASAESPPTAALSNPACRRKIWLTASDIRLRSVSSKQTACSSAALARSLPSPAPIIDTGAQRRHTEFSGDRLLNGSAPPDSTCGRHPS